MTTLDRRTLLRGLLGGAAVAIALPPLECMVNPNGTAWADGSIFPKRFGLWTWANGTLPDRWTPIGAGEGDAWQLSDQLAPLAIHKPKLSVISGLEVKAFNSIPHYSGFGPFLTGLEQIGEEGNNTFGGPTIDQIIASRIGTDTAYPSIEAGAWYEDAISHNGPYSPNPPERDVHRLFERLFGPTFREPGTDAVIDPKLALRQSVLDVVKGQVDSLNAKLGATDRARLDQHLSGIRNLEQRLARLAEGPPDYAACRRADTPPTEEELADPFAKSRAIADILALAMACDMTRVVSVVFMPPISNYLFPGATEGHHQLTHNEPGDQPTVHANTVKAMEEMSYFLSALDAIPEGDATLLDHAIVLGTSDVSLGKTHAIDEYPCVLAGLADGALRGNVHYRSPAENASKAPLTILRALGIDAPSFGVDDFEATTTVGALEV
ncbi:MAG: DUF1552 domain-containing protein [Alphaproteobacteria bacterium]|nr:DUF1552 domain-containing protein [Alphaproteobacteria bacterium]